ncbi:MAG: acyl-CoA/acyl-ACP dehydrogenase [Ktedonobacteraceae bacterium]|nr:acyl-CoA/acyl-ACP dehydrogenase [Ktedonobacteraceae bacterium]
MTEIAERLEMINEVAQGIIKRFDRAYWLKCVREHRFTNEMWQAMGEAGLLGLGVPEEFGGAGGGVTEMVALMEVLAEAGIPPLFLVVTGLSRVPIIKYGTQEQNRRYVEPTTTGQKKLCFAITEPDAGTNTFKMQTLARPAADGWVLNGQKVFISGANESDYMLVVCRTRAFSEGEDRQQGLSLFVVDTRSAGIELQKLNINVGWPEQQFLVFFNDVVLPADALIGKEGAGTKYLFDGLNPERLLVAAMSVGIGNYALRRAVEYAKIRAPFGKPIGAYQGLQHPMARAKTHLEAARLMMYKAAECFDAGEKAGPESNMAKLLASEAAVEAVDIAIQTHGGNGFDADYDIITLWPGVRLLQVAPINNEMLLNYIGEHVLGLPKSY